jgi:hypothetical protein
VTFAVGKRKRVAHQFPGEPLNSSATGVEYMKPVWPRPADAKLNSVPAGVSWNQIEPQEGKFDFSALDGIIQGARRHNLRLVLPWFGERLEGSRKRSL